MNDLPKEPEWPRTVYIRPIASEVMRRELDEDYDPDEDSGYALAFTQGAMIERIRIESWDDLCIPSGYELVNDRDRADYNSHHAMKEHKKRR